MLRLSTLIASRALQNAAALVLTKGLLVGFRIFVLFLAAKILGPSGFGQIVFLFAVVEIIRVVADFGTENFFLPHFVRSRGLSEDQDNLGRMIAFRLWTTAAGLLAYFVVVASAGRVLDGTVVIIGCLIPSSMWIATSLTYFQANLQMQRAAIAMSVAGVAGLGAVAATWPARPLPLFAALVVFELLAGALLFAPLARRQLFRWAAIRAHLGPPRIIHVASMSWAVAGGSLLAVIYTRLDVFVIDQLLGAAAMGLYGYAFRLTEPFRFVSNAIDSTLYSLLSRPEQLQRLREREFLWRLIIGASVYAAMFAVASVLLGLALAHGPFNEYRSAIPAAIVLSSALAPRCLNGAMTAFQYAIGRFDFILKLAGVNLALVALLIWPMTTWLGITGAALTLLMVELWNTAVQFRYARRALRELGNAPTSAAD